MKLFFCILSVILWAVVIFLFSSVPGKDYPAVFFDYGLFAHLIEFFVLGFLVARAFGKYSFKNLIFALTICLLYALSDEIHQTFVPFRSVSMIDWMVDGWGSVLGACLYFIQFQTKKHFKLKTENLKLKSTTKN